MSIKSIYKRIVPERIRNNIRIKLIQSKAHRYEGNTYRCNVCDSHFKQFLPHGNIPRENARCPNCLSLERTRILWLYLKNEVLSKSQKKIKILHFAPELGLYKQLKNNELVDYTNVDINPALADQVMDITKIDAPSQSFHYIICSHVLGHVKNEREAILEMYRVLKPGGKALVLTLIDHNIKHTYENPYLETEQERQALYGEPDLVRLHGRDFAKRLGKAEFIVNEIDYAEQLGESARKYYSLGNGDREIIFECVKPIK